MSDSMELFRGFFGGAVAGSSQVFVMQPFEIIKVRLVNQSLTNPEYKGIIHCFKRILKEEGFKSFWRGIFCHYSGTVSPLIGYGLQGSFAFGSNELFKDLITYIDGGKQKASGGNMPMSHVF